MFMLNLDYQLLKHQHSKLYPDVVHSVISNKDPGKFLPFAQSIILKI